MRERKREREKGREDILRQWENNSIFTLTTRAEYKENVNRAEREPISHHISQTE
jgi:hypothetical protein